MMDDQIGLFREEVMRLRGGRKRGAPAYSAEIVARGRALAERLEAVGQTRAQAAARLGIADGTLMKWKTGAGGFKRVRVAVNAPGAVPTGQGGRSEGIRLISPRGYQVAGIDAATAVAILREVG